MMRSGINSKIVILISESCRKRFTLVDTPSLLIAVSIMAASTPEREGAKKLLLKVKAKEKQHPRLILIFADGCFNGKDFIKSIMDLFGLIIEVVLEPQEVKEFQILPKRPCCRKNLWLV